MIYDRRPSPKQIQTPGAGLEAVVEVAVMFDVILRSR